MSTTALEVRELQAGEVVSRVRAIQQLMEAVMKKDVHYGVIPGTQKPTLYKAGSEQILAMFQIAVEPIVEDLSTDDECRIRVICRMTAISSGRYLGSGVGEASSSEQKYKWRKVVSKAEWDHFQQNFPDKCRIKFSASWDHGKRIERQEEQIRAEIPDIRNTILKMAKKRAQIDATLTVTGCSDMFQQDIEDLPEELQSQVAENEQAQAVVAPVKPTRKKSEAPAVPSTPTSPSTAERNQGAVQGRDGFSPQHPGEVEYISDPQRKRLLAIQGSAKVSDETLKDWMEKTFKITSRSRIPKHGGTYEKIVDFLDPEFKFHQEEF